MKDGVYFNLPEDVYHAEKRLSSSGIRDILENPTYFWFNSNFNPLKDERKSEAMTDGRIFHTLILEGENFKNKYKVTPPEIEALNKNSNDFKMWKNAQTLEIIAGAKYRKFKTICEYLSQEGQLLDCDVFNNGFSEVSILWTENGIKRKARIDYLKQKAIIDLKTYVKTKKTPLNSYVSQYFFSYKVYLQLIYYRRAVLFALNNDLPVEGTKEQLSFWESMKGAEDLLTEVAFVNRELPQFALKVFLKSRCPDLWRIGEQQIKQAEFTYQEFVDKYGEKNAWLQDVDKLSEEILFNDTDFPQSFYEVLQGGFNE